MHKPHTLCSLLQVTTRRALLALGLIVGLSACIGVAGASGSGGDSWQEEVLLHDGRTIVVERSQTYGGGHEIGQRPPVRDMTITFAMPSSGKRISWASEYGEDVGRSNFMLAALHILNDTPYVVALPNLCQSYNKWGRPNPPYVIFKYQANAWARIPMAELPTEFKSTNLVVESLGHSATLARLGRVSAEMVKQLNGQMTQPEYREILREPIRSATDSCGEIVGNGKGSWIGLGWFRRQPNLEACEDYCKAEKFGEKFCPCKKLFEGK